MAALGGNVYESSQSSTTRGRPNESIYVPDDVTVPTSWALPASLLLAARPRWVGAIAWPAIGPDVTGGEDPSGHAHRIPAQVCFEATPKQADGGLSFNAITCDGS